MVSKLWRRTDSGWVSVFDEDAYVKVTGGTITGNLTINTPYTLSFGATTRQMVNLYDTRFGIGVQASTTYFRSSAYFSWFRNGVHSDVQGDPGAGGVEAMRLGNTGILHLLDTATADKLRLYGIAASEAPFLSFYKSDRTTRFGYMQATAGNVLIYAEQSGSDITLNTNGGQVRATDAIYASALSRFPSGSYIYGTGTATGLQHSYIQLHGRATNVDTLGTRSGYVGFPNSGVMYLYNEAGTSVVVRTDSASGNIDFYTGGAYRCRVAAGGEFLVAKTVLDTTTTGVGIWDGGRIYITAPTANHYCLIPNITAAEHGDIYAHFRRSDVGLGYIYGFSASGAGAAAAEIRYYQGSDERWKGDITDIDGDWALERLMAWRPRSFRWRQGPDGRMASLYEPTGGERHGFIAQEMHAVSPDAATLGHGEEVELWEWLEAKERGEDVGDIAPFEPAAVDNGVLFPDLVAACQAMYRRITALEERNV